MVSWVPSCATILWKRTWKSLNFSQVQLYSSALSLWFAWLGLCDTASETNAYGWYTTRVIFGLTRSDPYIWGYKPNYCYFWPESLTAWEVAKYFLCGKKMTFVHCFNCDDCLKYMGSFFFFFSDCFLKMQIRNFICCKIYHT